MVRIEGSTGPDQPEFIRLIYDYHHRDGTSSPVNIRIELDRMPSNLGKDRGHRYFFICPYTGTRCYKLHRPPGQKVFAHRSYFPGLMYDNQACSQKDRTICALLQQGRKLRKLEAPRRLRSYGGKPTRLYYQLERLYWKLDVYGSHPAVKRLIKR